MSKFKHKYNYSEEESSESDDGEDSLLKEVDDLVRDCMLTTTTTTTTNSGKNNVGISPTDEENVGISPTDDDEEEDDDFKMCQNIKRMCGDSEPLCLEPLMTLPPYVSDEDDDEDDFETFADIQRRYGNRNDHVSCEETTTSANDDDYNDGVGVGGFGGEFASEEYNEEEEEEEDDNSRSGGFPKSALMLLEAIKKNRECQKLVKEKMQHIETVIEKNAKFRKVVKTVKDYHVKLKKDLGRAMSHKVCPQVLLISSRVQRNSSVMSYGPTDNSQVEWCKAALERFPVMFQRKKWSNQEKQDLRKGLVQQYQQMLFQEIADAADGSVGVDAVVSRVADCDVTPEIIQDFCFRGDVNWDRLALVSVPGRSGAECEAMWFNHENSLINKSKWTGEEDKKLLATILSKWTGEDWSGIYDWSWIAAKLGTNRTPFQCCARYQRSLNASLLRREWSKAEDAQLRSVVEDLGVSDWQAVASKLEGRTGTQCSDRWRKYLDPVITRVGKWSDEEDKRLKVAVKFLGKKWTSVAQFVPGRTDVQCRDRWENVLDPGLRWGEWSAEEDSKLEAAVLKFGYSSWSKVAASLGTRTDNQCWRRWKALFPEQVAEARDARMLVKDALPSNFVGREAERPALGAKDFTPLLTAGQADEQNSHKALQKQKKSRKRGETVQKKSRNKGNTNQKKSRKSKLTDDAAEELGGSEGGKSGKRKRSATSSEIKDTGERKKRKTANSGTKKNKRRGSRNTAPEYEEKSSESTESDEIRDLQSCKNKESDKATETDTSEWQIPKIRSRRSREIKVRGRYS